MEEILNTDVTIELHSENNTYSFYMLDENGEEVRCLFDLESILELLDKAQDAKETLEKLN